MIKCRLCNFEGFDLKYHIDRIHKMSTEEYRRKTGGRIVSKSVLAKRQKTSLERYGEKHFTNRKAAELSYQAYQNGHPLKDPAVRKKATRTMKDRYGDPHYTNREKAKETTRQRYGCDYTCQIPEAIEKRKATLLKRYGKIFNVEQPCNKWHPDEAEFRRDFQAGISIDKMALKYGVSEPTIRRVMSELGLKRAFVSKTKRVIESPVEATARYLQECLRHKKALSFYDYGKFTEVRNCTKMKRLYNGSGKYSSLKQELFAVAADPREHVEFLQKLS